MSTAQTNKTSGEHPYHNTSSEDFQPTMQEIHTFNLTPTTWENLPQAGWPVYRKQAEQPP